MRKTFQHIASYFDNFIFYSVYLTFEEVNKRYQDHKIYTQNIMKLSSVSRLSYLGFDKTGTLTETKIEFKGMLTNVEFHDQKISLNKSELQEDKQDKMMMFMGLCHQMMDMSENIKQNQMDHIPYLISEFVLESSAQDDVRTIRASEEFA